MSIALSVNLNKIALIRNSRPGNYPDVTEHGRSCLEAGVQGLTVHPRPDQRHIRPQDVEALAELVGRFPGTEFNVEGNPFAEPVGTYPGLLALVEQFRPHQCTLVPDSNDQATSDHGFDLDKDSRRLEPVIRQLRDWGVRVSLFMDPDPHQIELAAALGADRIELYTGPYAAAVASRSADLEVVFERYRVAAIKAAAVGLGINAGHDLNLVNLPRFATIPGLLEFSIGHALIVDAISMGLARTLRLYLDACQNAAH